MFCAATCGGAICSKRTLVRGSCDEGSNGQDRNVAVARSNSGCRFCTAIAQLAIERLCRGDRRCDTDEVASHNVLTDQMWPKATAQRRSDCMAWEAEFFRRYWPER